VGGADPGGDAVAQRQQDGADGSRPQRTRRDRPGGRRLLDHGGRSIPAASLYSRTRRRDRARAGRPGGRPIPRARALAAPLLGLCLAVCGCGGQTSGVDARSLLRQGKTAIDAASALHFALDSKDAPSSGGGTYITSGEGDARRPDAVTGTLQVLVNGLPLRVAMVSTGGAFYVKLPFSTGYDRTDPSRYGFSDPARLIDPRAGLSSLLADATQASDAGRDRFRGEELQEVEVTLPGGPVARLLTSADSGQDVHGRVGIDPRSHQVRRVVLTGPFFDAHQQSTYTVILDRYGETVQITPPPTG
jgi:lipoprotein LprG